MAIQKGEALHESGATGVQQAKRWLESTLVAEVLWTAGRLGQEKLLFDRADGKESFSFDMGGMLTGHEHKSKVFYGESKHYQNSSDQGTHYRKFLAQCYRVEASQSTEFVDVFLWITFAPFLVNSWSEKETPEFIQKAIEDSAHNQKIALDTAAFDADIAKRVSEKLVIVVISDQQLEVLTLQGDELVKVRQALIEVRRDTA